MLGAIIGDVVGSRFEFDRGGKTKDFELFTKEDCFTDDTCMTIAVAEALLSAGMDADVRTIKSSVIKSMKKWGYAYPNAGYGGRFYQWLFYYKNPKPYGSYGNGSAMRVSSAGWLYDSLERTREVAGATAEVTHNHPEGIKGAECTASVIFLSRTGASKEYIKEYVVSEFGYDLSESLDQMRKRHAHIESCQDSLPKALVSFFEGKSYEDIIRNAISLGGDTDTLAAIAGAMAEAYYGIPVSIVVKGKEYLPDDMLEVVDCFNKHLHGTEDYTIDNQYIKQAVQNVLECDSYEARLTLLVTLVKRLQDQGEVYAPMIDKNHVMDNVQLDDLTLGKTFTISEEMRLAFDLMQEDSGKLWIPLFTDDEERHLGQMSNIVINVPIQTIIESGLYDETLSGVVINPFSDAFLIPKPILEFIMKSYHSKGE